MYELNTDVQKDRMIIPKGTPVSGVYDLDGKGNLVCFAHIPGERVRLYLHESILSLQSRKSPPTDTLR